MAFTRFYKMHPVLGSKIESIFNNYARKISEYDGGDWQVVVDKDDVYAVYPVSQDTFTVGHDGNYVEPAPLSSRAFGVYISLVIYNSLCWQFHEMNQPDECETFSSMYHSLRIWLLDSDEIPQHEINHIMRMID
ncbi:antirestriction protein [Vibrio parahaemolyticus]|nr:antirestriction protein [Vibrio parahaemolyticus]